MNPLLMLAIVLGCAMAAIELLSSPLKMFTYGAWGIIVKNRIALAALFGVLWIVGMFDQDVSLASNTTVISGMFGAYCAFLVMFEELGR